MGLNTTVFTNSTTMVVSALISFNFAAIQTYLRPEWFAYRQIRVWS
ncbi:hypothetical protein C900_00352 [Fulvivirga imtechensis AK7]|uniref:Uncharacterized protein n=1 Tax=Fulvivirga imtechensis AK7 TaxID=1237149 RepID=L8JLR0_9BACT|nr:hypothetical protein C900_00352 [Fulvivirga imtechensis AK7]